MINKRTVDIELYHKRLLQDLLKIPYVSTPPFPGAEETDAAPLIPPDEHGDMDSLAYAKGLIEGEAYPEDSGVEKLYEETPVDEPTKITPSKRGRPEQDDEEEPDSRYGAVSSGQKRQKVALDFVSDDEASDGVRMVAVAVSSGSSTGDSDWA